MINWSNHFLFSFILSYLKPYNFVQTNVHNQIEIVTWNYIIMYKY